MAWTPREASCMVDTAGVSLGLIDLVDGNDDGNLGGLGVIDGFEGLGHDAVVGGHDHDDDVGDLGAACTHAGEGLVAGGIEEDDLAAEGRRVFLGDADLVGTDVLGDAAGFASGDVGGADGVEQRGLAVIDVAHDGDDGRTHDLDETGGVLEEAFDGFVLDLLFDGDDLRVGAELAGDGFDELGVERLVDRDHDAAEEQGSDEIFTANLELLGEVLDGDAFGDGDGAGDGEIAFGDLRSAHARGVTLEGDFLVLDVALVAASAGGWTGGTAGSCRGVRGRKQATGTNALTATAGTSAEAGTGTEAGTCAGATGTAGASGEGARGVHGPAGAGSQRATCAGTSGATGTAWAATGGLRARALEDGAAGGVRGAGSGGVGWARAGLRHDDAPDRRSRGCCGGCLRRGRNSGCRCRSGGGRSCRSGRGGRRSRRSGRGCGSGRSRGRRDGRRLDDDGGRWRRRGDCGGSGDRFELRPERRAGRPRGAEWE